MKLELAYDGDFEGKILSKDMIKDITHTFGEYGSIPVVRGHWTGSGEPAEGWIKSVKMRKKNDKTYLIADNVELLEPMKTEYAEGKYKNWSIGAARKTKLQKDGSRMLDKWFLFHLAMLGADLPAIPNLNDLTPKENVEASSAPENNETEKYVMFDNVEHQLHYFSFGAADKVFQNDLEEEEEDNNKTETKDKIFNASSIDKRTTKAEDIKMDIQKLQEKLDAVIAEKVEITKNLDAEKVEKENYAKKIEEFKKVEMERIEAKENEAKENFTKVMTEKAIPADLKEKVFKCENKADFFDCFSQILASTNKLDGEVVSGNQEEIELNSWNTLQKEMKI